METKHKPLRLIVSSLFILLAFLVLLLPIAIAEKSVLPPRVLNIVNYTFILAVPYLIFSLTKENVIFKKFFILVFFVFIVIFNQILPFNNGNYCLACRDIFSGKAAIYDAQPKVRYAFLAHDPGQYEIVPCPTDPPKSLFLGDITPNPDFWRNTEVAKWWGKRGIKTDSWSCYNTIK